MEMLNNMLKSGSVGLQACSLIWEPLLLQFHPKDSFQIDLPKKVTLLLLFYRVVWHLYLFAFSSIRKLNVCLQEGFFLKE